MTSEKQGVGVHDDPAIMPGGWVFAWGRPLLRGDPYRGGVWWSLPGLPKRDVDQPLNLSAHLLAPEANDVSDVVLEDLEYVRTEELLDREFLSSRSSSSADSSEHTDVTTRHASDEDTADDLPPSLHRNAHTGSHLARRVLDQRNRSSAHADLCGQRRCRRSSDQEPVSNCSGLQRWKLRTNASRRFRPCRVSCSIQALNDHTRLRSFGELTEASIDSLEICAVEFELHLASRIYHDGARPPIGSSGRAEKCGFADREKWPGTEMFKG